jgi:hypothetical protein
VEVIGDNAFADCANISTIYLKDFDAPPAWGSPTDIFYGWAESGTVVSDGNYSSGAALNYLKTLGLPEKWIAGGQAL